MSNALNGVWLFVICLLLTACSPPNQPGEVPQAVDGHLDLQGWNFNEHGLVNLSGEWVFHWQELLFPSEAETDINSEYVPVPGTWTDYEINDQALPAEGFATYRLTVQLPDPPQAYGLFIEGEGTAYALWVDGQLVAWNGRVGINSQEMVAQSIPRTVFFQSDGDSTELVMQISNFHHRKAGFRNEIILGLPSQIHEYQRNGWAQDAFVLGIFLVMGIYHLFIYAFRPQDISPLYFAIWSFFNLLRTSLLGQKLLLVAFPNISWEFALQLEYLTFYFSAPIYALFIQTLYPKDVHRWAMRTIIGLGILFSSLMLFLDTLTLSYTVTPYQIVLLIEIFYFVFFIGRILARKREGAIYVAIASLLAFTGIILEALYLQNISPLQFDSSITFLGFILVQAILLSSRLSKSFSRVEDLSSELETTNTSLRESEIKYRSIFEESNDMIFTAGLDEKIKDANPSCLDILGYTREELRDMKISDFVVQPENTRQIKKILREQNIVKDYELEIRQKEGNIIHGLLTLTFRRNEAGDIAELQGNIHDISAKKQVEAEQIRAMEFEQLSITDPLTGIYNRRFFDEIAGKELERAKRSTSPLTIIILDIDHFKEINDTYGHPTGDQVLISLTNIYQSNMRSMDIFARYGGEEFIILMPDTDSESAHQIIERLRAALEETPLATYENKDIYVTISAGIAVCDGQESVDIPALLERADQSLYTSKQTGRNKTTIWREA
ncbi:MAG TPA: diguanylate cyclase [Anaerolineales bacterium]|nr:diguanylate cyclase [Anaerolineales bacterium]